jgi:hypothetical protein
MPESSQSSSSVSLSDNACGYERGHPEHHAISLATASFPSFRFQSGRGSTAALPSNRSCDGLRSGSTRLGSSHSHPRVCLAR